MHNGRGNLRSRRRAVAISIAAVALVYLMIESVAFVGLLVLEGMGKNVYAPTLRSEVSDAHREILTRVINGEARYIGYSQQLGWTTLPYGRNELYQANSQGVRGVREYSTVPEGGTLRVAAFGDSFVHGDDVPNAEAWSILMEEAEPTLEVMNFGVGGYGPDQAYLRYLEEGHRYSPQVVLIGYQTENINRVVNVFRPFYSPNSGNPLAKPYFEISDGRLVLHANPIASLSGYERLLDDPASVLGPMAEQDFHYRHRYTKGAADLSPFVRLGKGLFFEYKTRFMSPLLENGQFSTSSEPYRLLVEILEAFHCDVVARGSLPLIVLFPNRDDVEVFRDDGAQMYAPLLDQLQGSGRIVIELVHAFAAALEHEGVGELVQNHYTGRGNELVADFLRAELTHRELFDGGTLDELIESQRAVCTSHRTIMQ